MPTVRINEILEAMKEGLEQWRRETDEFEAFLDEIETNEYAEIGGEG